MPNITARRGRIVRASRLPPAVMLVICCAVHLYATSQPQPEDRYCGLTQDALSTLAVQSESGNCAASYRVGQYHLYASLDHVQAEKYYRRGAACGDPNAITGLIIVLRGPEHDTELDHLVATLTRLDPEKGAAAALEIADRRSYRQIK